MFSNDSPPPEWGVLCENPLIEGLTLRDWEKPPPKWDPPLSPNCQCPAYHYSTHPPTWAPYKKFSEGSTMSEDIKAQVRAIAHEIARREVFEHEIRFTLSGMAIGAVAVLAWLVATGRF